MKRLLPCALACWAAAALAAEPAFTGPVLERLDAAGYSYLRVRTAQGERWAAVPLTTVAPGEVVTVDAQADLRDFQSPTLKRRWAVLTFGTLARSAAAAPSAPATPAASPHAASPHAAGLPKAPPAAPPLEGTVLEVLDTTAYTYLRLATTAGPQWAAVPRAKVAVGEAVRVKHPLAMGAFTSPSLGRRFEAIVFGRLATGAD